MNKYLTIRLPKRLIKAALVMTLAAVVISPIAVSASHVFDDVDDSNTFHEDIAWLADAGVTLGCNPPANNNYCPDNNVTRAQMSAFMRRLAENQVVDAATAITADSATKADSATNADKATTADDAALLDGMTAAELTASAPLGTGYYRLGTVFGTGVTGITNPELGVYCVTIDPALGLTADQVMVQVAVEWGASAGFDLFAFWQGSAPTFACSETEFEVRTYQFSYDGDGDVVDVELNGSVAWTYAMYTRGETAATLSSPAVATTADTNTGS